MRSGLRVPASIRPCFTVSASCTVQPSALERGADETPDLGLVLDQQGHGRRARSRGLALHPAAAFPGAASITKRAPLATPGSAVIVPLWASTIARQMASPRPTPGVADSFSPRVNFSKIASSLPLGSPGPSSATVSRRRSPCARCGDHDARPRRRVLRGVLEQVHQHALDQHRVDLDQRQVARHVDLDLVPGKRGAASTGGRSPPLPRRTAIRGCRRTSPLWMRAMSSRLLTSAISRARLLADRARDARPGPLRAAAW